MATTFRSDLRAGLATLLDTFIAAQPDTVLVRRFNVRPENLAAHETPYAFIDMATRPEEISHTAGTRERLAQPSIVLVDRISENLETSDRFDDTVDLFVDACTATPNVVTGTIWDRMTVSDEYDEGMYLVRFAFNNLSIREGRD